MLIPFGKSVGNRGESVPVVLDTTQAVNGHGMFVGTSGMGKTHRILDAVTELVNSAAQLRRPIRVHVINALIAGQTTLQRLGIAADVTRRLNQWVPLRISGRPSANVTSLIAA